MQQIRRHIVIAVINQFVHLTLGKLTGEIVHSILFHSSLTLCHIMWCMKYPDELLSWSDIIMHKSAAARLVIRGFY